MTIFRTIITICRKNQQMLFNYHGKEIFQQCAFSSRTKEIRCLQNGGVGDNATALTQIGTMTYCTPRTPSETEEGRLMKHAHRRNRVESRKRQSRTFRTALVGFTLNLGGGDEPERHQRLAADSDFSGYLKKCCYKQWNLLAKSNRKI